MIKQSLIGLAIFMLCSIHAVKAQNSVNSIILVNKHELASPNEMSGIVFTPQGIVRTPENGGTRSVKMEDKPIVLKYSFPALSKIINVAKEDVIETLSPLQYKYAMMMDVNIESLKNLALLSFIEDWYGTPYRLGGTSKRGIDCSALTRSILQSVYDINVPRTARQQYKFTRHIKRKDLREGDLVFFNTHGGVSHVGLYLGNDYFVQASSSQGVMISSLNSRYFSKRFICGGRIEGEEVQSEE